MKGTLVDREWVLQMGKVGRHTTKRHTLLAKEAIQDTVKCAPIPATVYYIYALKKTIQSILVETSARFSARF